MVRIGLNKERRKCETLIDTLYKATLTPYTILQASQILTQTLAVAATQFHTTETTNHG